MTFYPEKISRRFYAPQNVGKAEKANAVGMQASFVCGCMVRYFLEIDPQSKQICQAKFKTNGCGFMIAAADVLATVMRKKLLIELHGLDKNALWAKIEAELGVFPANRRHCLETCLEAMEEALADFRRFQLQEFTGEKALICTCFGVSEEEIEKVISENDLETVEEVGEFCLAGTGCGSCRLLIEEMLDVNKKFSTRKIVL
jgi:NifU-like protein